jgi:tetratricopeptide (TPR) repeat protein
MSTSTPQGSPDRRSPRRRPAGFFGWIAYYATAPARALAARREGRRGGKGKGRAPSLAARVVWAISAPLRWINAAARSTFRWFARYATTRNGLYLLQGLPAILVFIGTIVLGILAFVYTRPASMVEFYRKKGEEATRAWERTPPADSKKRKELLDRAAVCYERWAMLEPWNDEPKYFSALTANRSEDPEKKALALNLMSQLARADRPGGYRRAHVWLAEFYLNLMANTMGDPQKTIAYRDLAEVHLMRVLMLDPENLEAHQRLAGLYAQLRRFDRAEQHFLRILPLDEGVNMHLAEIYFNTGRTEKGMEYARKARDYFRKRLETEGDDHEMRKRLAAQHIRLKEYQQAIDVLTDGLKLAPERSDLRQMIGRVYLARMIDLSGDAFEERLKLYDEVVRYDPGNNDAFAFLVEGLKPTNPLLKQTQEKIDTILATNPNGVFHFLLANQYMQQNKDDLAIKHLEASVRLNPSLLVAANNLAWKLAHEAKDYNRALKHLDAAINHAREKGLEGAIGNLLDTRGHVYLLMGRIPDACKDLERAKDMGLAQNKETRAALLRCYQLLNKHDLAEEEARIVQVLRDMEAKQQKTGAAEASPLPPG